MYHEQPDHGLCLVLLLYCFFCTSNALAVRMMDAVPVRRFSFDFVKLRKIKNFDIQNTQTYKLLIQNYMNERVYNSAHKDSICQFSL